MLFTIHTQLHGYNRILSVLLQPPTEANLIFVSFQHIGFAGFYLLIFENHLVAALCKHIWSTLAAQYCSLFISEALAKTILHIKKIFVSAC